MLEKVEISAIKWLCTTKSENNYTAQINNEVTHLRNSSWSTKTGIYISRSTFDSISIDFAKTIKCYKYG